MWVQDFMTIPSEIKQKKTSIISFRISEEMVTKFAALTGDQSLLHSRKEFARRSVYRQQIVHGMLPMAFTALLDFFQIDGFVCSLVELVGQFFNPVFIGDELILTGEIVDINEEDSLVKCNYSIEKPQTGTVMSKGAVTVTFSNTNKREKTSGSTQTPSHFASMITEPIHLQNFKLEEISKNDTDSFPFMVTESAIDSLLEILSEGIGKKDTFDLYPIKERFSFPELLSTMLFSTSVGMCIPGKYATFLKFEMEVRKAIDMNTSCFLIGEVVHKSESTRIIKKGISVHKSGNKNDIYLAGKVAVLVNPHPVKMPTIRQLKESAFDMGIKKKVVLITGASRGLGETTAKLFALHGAKVIVNYFRGKDDAERIVKEVIAEGGEAICLPADVSDPVQVQKMVLEAIEHYGAINVLVNNAVRDFRPVGFSSLTWEDIQKEIDVIIKGAFHCCQAVIPLMLKQSGGKIINMGTLATENPPPNQVKYVISKSGLVGLTRSLAREFASKNIQVNMVVPNFLNTDLTSHIPGVYKDKIAMNIPMQRIASPVDVAKAIIFLASSYSSYTTGQKIMVTGGDVPFL